MDKELDVCVERSETLYDQVDYQNMVECDILYSRLPSDQDSLEGYPGQEQEQKGTYRTENRAKTSDTLPEKIPIISRGDWIDAISFQENKYAYMHPKDSSKKLPEIQTLRYLYGAFKIKNPIDVETDDLDQIPDGWLDRTLTIYLPRYIKSIGVKSNRGNESVKAVINKIEGYADLVGVVREEECEVARYREYPVIKDLVYDEQDNTITFSSPYMMMIIRKVESSRICRNKDGNPVRDKRGRLILSAAYSYRLDPKILHEKNERAVEVTGLIAKLIDRAGSPKKKDKNKNGDPVDDDDNDKVAHIGYIGIINRCEKLKREYEDLSTTSNKNRMLESVFRKTWEFLLEYTDIKSAYKNIQLPDPKDKDFEKYIPTTKRLKEVLRFPHDGKRKGR